MSKLPTLASSVIGVAAALAFSTAAQAGCNSGAMYCGSSHNAGHTSAGHHTGTTSLPPLSSYFDYERGHAPAATRYSSTSSYGATPRYGASYASSSSSSYTSSYSGVLSESAASATYDSGSISSSYAGGDVQLYGFSGTPDLGAGESLQATNCPVDVIGATPGSNVLGCYNVVRQDVRPVANTTYYRVVRPVIYVRYPVPVPVPYTVNVPSYGHSYSHASSRYGYGASRYGSPCGAKVNSSRYGGYGPQGGYGLGCR